MHIEGYFLSNTQSWTNFTYTQNFFYHIQTRKPIFFKGIMTQQRKVRNVINKIETK